MVDKNAEVTLSSGEGVFDVQFGGNTWERPVIYFTGAGFSDAPKGRRTFLAGFDKVDEARALGKRLIEVADAYDAMRPKKFAVTVNVEAQNEDEAEQMVQNGGYLGTAKRV